MVRLSDLCRNPPTDEEKVEDLRRRRMIRKGQHPDTGKRLRWSDLERGLRPLEQLDAEIWIRGHLTNAPSLSPYPFLNRAQDDALRNSVAVAQRALDGASRWAATSEQMRFLREFRANIGLFRSGLPLSEDILQRSDLLACIALPPSAIVGFDHYAQENVERFQRYGASLLAELAVDFEREGNPVHAWEAVAVAARSGIERPDWVENFIDEQAARIMEIREQVSEGHPVGREADRVGKALGFAIDGPGQGGRFKQATMLQRDRTIYFEIRDKLDSDVKLDAAYSEVATAFGVSRSLVVRAYLRIIQINGEDSEGGVS